ncbi:MAG: hypothetical protein ABI068_05995, partial [Ktedonobacterales bacterium]
MQTQHAQTLVIREADDAPHFGNLIDGTWTPASDGRESENRDPANGELIGYFPRSSQGEVDAAVAAAKRAPQDALDGQ